MEFFTLMPRTKSSNTIVLDITDIRRKFEPILFMYTSHETQTDYEHFFESLLTLGKRFNFNFEPSHMTKDASKAVSKKKGSGGAK